MTVLINWIDSQKEFWVYLAVGICSLVENLFTPFPGDTVTVFGAYLAGLGQVNAAGIYLASTIGGTTGFVGLYLAGRIFIRKMEGKDRFFGMNASTYDKISHSFRRWGYWIIIFNRLLYGLRFAVALFAGFAKLDLRKTIAAALIGTALWNIILVYLGMQLGENWGIFKEVLWKYNRVVLAVAAFGLGIYLVWRMRSRKKRMTNIGHGI